MPARLPVTGSLLPRHMGSGCSEGRRGQGPQLHEVELTHGGTGKHEVESEDRERKQFHVISNIVFSR